MHTQVCGRVAAGGLALRAVALWLPLRTCHWKWRTRRRVPPPCATSNRVGTSPSDPPSPLLSCSTFCFSTARRPSVECVSPIPIYIYTWYVKYYIYTREQQHTLPLTCLYSNPYESHAPNVCRLARTLPRLLTKFPSTTWPRDGQGGGAEKEGGRAVVLLPSTLA